MYENNKKEEYLYVFLAFCYIVFCYINNGIKCVSCLSIVWIPINYIERHGQYITTLLVFTFIFRYMST